MGGGLNLVPDLLGVSHEDQEQSLLTVQER